MTKILQVLILWVLQLSLLVPLLPEYAFGSQVCMEKHASGHEGCCVDDHSCPDGDECPLKDVPHHHCHYVTVSTWYTMDEVSLAVFAPRAMSLKYRAEQDAIPESPWIELEKPPLIA